MAVLQPCLLYTVKGKIQRHLHFLSDTKKKLYHVRRFINIFPCLKQFINIIPFLKMFIHIFPYMGQFIYSFPYVRQFMNIFTELAHRQNSIWYPECPSVCGMSTIML